MSGRDVLKFHTRAIVECFGSGGSKTCCRQQGEIEAWIRWNRFEGGGIIIDFITKLPDGWSQQDNCFVICPRCTEDRRTMAQIQELQKKLERL